MFIERRPVHHGVACSAVPARVSAPAVTQAGNMADEDLVCAKRVPVGASARCFGHPFAAGLDEVALHARSVARHGDSGLPRPQ